MMTKAYDIGELVLQVKGKGLDLAEESVKLLVGEIFKWIEASAKLSATPYDDMALIVLPKLKDFALSAVDKIDGKVD